MAEGDDFAYNDRVLREFWANDGRVGPPFDGALVALLHLVGAKSGRPRVSPVVYVEFEGEPLIAASSNGLPEHPAWYYNLAAMDAVTVDLATDTGIQTIRARPRELRGEERERGFRHLASVHSRFTDYARRTAGIREIPVLVLGAEPQD